MARERNLPVAHAEESQEICFIPDGDYVGFLLRNGVPATPGPIVDQQGNVLESTGD